MSLKTTIRRKLRPAWHRVCRTYIRASTCWVPTGFPKVVHLENTNACNANCIMCARDKMTRPIGFMKFDLFEKLTRECAGHRQVRELHLHGYGEPLLDKELPKKINLAKRLGIPYTYIVTNAELLSTEVAEGLILSGLDGIKFSIYGASKETFERIHKGLHFHRVTENVRDFFAVRQYLNRKTPRVTIQFLPFGDNEGERIPFYEQWHGYIDANLGDRLRFFRLHNWAGGRSYNPVIDKGHSRVCSYPFTHIHILWDGTVVPCCFDFDATSAMGDAVRSSISQVWRNKEYAELRAICLDRRYHIHPLCKRCDVIVDRTDGSHGLEEGD